MGRRVCGSGIIGAWRPTCSRALGPRDRHGRRRSTRRLRRARPAPPAGRCGTCCSTCCWTRSARWWRWQPDGGRGRRGRGDLLGAVPAPAGRRRPRARGVRARRRPRRTPRGRCCAEQWRDDVARPPCAPRGPPTPPAGCETQGHVITVRRPGLDAGRRGDRAPARPHRGAAGRVRRPPAALRHTRGVLEAPYGGPLPAAWDDTEAVLRGTGRLPADDPRLPLLG